MAKKLREIIESKKRPSTADHTEEQAVQHSMRFGHEAAEEMANLRDIHDHIADRIAETYHRSHGPEFVDKVINQVKKRFY